VEQGWKGFAPKAGTHVVEEGWKAERLKRPEAVRQFFFQASSLSAFGSGSEPTLCAKPAGRSKG
jgi:hypothetical protein